MKPPIDILYGSDALRTASDSEAGIDRLLAGWEGDTEAFLRTREQYLLY